LVEELLFVEGSREGLRDTANPNPSPPSPLNRDDGRPVMLPRGIWLVILGSLLRPLKGCLLVSAFVLLLNELKT
jgi:hypothetical protein